MQNVLHLQVGTAVHVIHKPKSTLSRVRHAVGMGSSNRYSTIYILLLLLLLASRQQIRISRVKHHTTHQMTAWITPPNETDTQL